MHESASIDPFSPYGCRFCPQRAEKLGQISVPKATTFTLPKKKNVWAVHRRPALWKSAVILADNNLHQFEWYLMLSGIRPFQQQQQN